MVLWMLHNNSNVAMHGQCSLYLRNLLFHITDLVGSGGNAWDVHLDGASFESWPGHQLWLSLVPPGKWWYNTLKQTIPTFFHILSKLLLIYKPVIGHYCWHCFKWAVFHVNPLELELIAQCTLQETGDLNGHTLLCMLLTHDFSECSAL